MTFLLHSKQLTMQVNFSGLLSTFWCHGNFWSLIFPAKKKPYFLDDPFYFYLFYSHFIQVKTSGLPPFRLTQKEA